MSDLIRLDLVGKDAQAWNRVFDTLTRVIVAAVDKLAPNLEAQQKEQTRQITTDIAEITKGWLKARLDKPALENEQVLADIAMKFEQLKTEQANRERIHVETDIKKVELAQKQLLLLEQQLTMAMKWMGFFQGHVSRDENGSVTLLLSRQDLAALMIDMSALQASTPTSKT